MKASSVDPKLLSRDLARAIPVFRSLSTGEQREIVRRALRASDAPSPYRKLSAERWASLGLSFPLSEASLDRIRAEVPEERREIAFACVAHGNCVRACAAFEILSAGIGKGGKPLRRLLVGKAHENSKIDDSLPYHVWLVCSRHGRIDPTEEQIRPFLGSVDYASGRRSGIPRYQTQGKYQVAEPFSRIRFGHGYIGILRRVCDLLLVPRRTK
jgi:hypothetical protein